MNDIIDAIIQELPVNNEFEARETLREERKEIKSFDDLVSFLQNVKDNYNTGYGTAPRAIAQAAIATAKYLSFNFGITGFQASCVMWDFIGDWLYSDNECGMRLVNYDDMLYPQYEYKFEKAIDKDLFDDLQRAAKKKLEEHKDAHPAVVAHWKSIVNGNVPFGYAVKEKRDI